MKYETTAPLAAISAGARRLAGIAVLAAPLWAAPARAQSAEPADTLTGRVTDPRGAPVAAATVRATGSDGRPHAASTDAAGVYLLAVPRGGGGRYVLTVERAGFTPYTAVVRRGAAEVKLARRVYALDTVQVQGSRVRLASVERRTPGQTGTAWTTAQTEALPMEPGELAAGAALEPGVVRLGGTDEGLAGLSIAGQPPSQNRTTVDGASFGASSLPPEAVRSTGVISNSYDVARGQFSGGMVAATTRSGTNVWGGALNATLNDPAFRFGELPGRAPEGGDRWMQLDGGAGGPLVRNRLFGYGAFQLSRRTGGASFLDPDDVAGLRQLDVSPDSARRFAEIARGIAPSAAPADERSGFASGLARMDLELGSRHTLALRVDGRTSRTTGAGASPLRLAGSTGEQDASSGGALLQLATRGPTWGNEARAFASGNSQGSTPGREIPEGVVQVGEGGGGISSFAFGGSALLYARARARLFEAADDFTWESPGQAHSVRIGAFVQEESVRLTGIGNAFGTFAFRGLAELEAGRPSSFTRTLAAPRREATARYAALYAGDTWRAGDRLQLMYGVRLEGASYPALSAVGPEVETRFGREPGRIPSELRASPRAGFRFDPGWGHNVSIHGGVGAFRGRLALRSLAGTLSETGAEGATERLVCIGAAAPAPRWEAYAADAATIPTTCADGASAQAERAPQVSVFAPGFAAPRVWRASLGGGMQLAGGRFLQLDGTLVRGAGQPLASDLNLNRTPRFALAEEGGRPVFAPSSAIDPRSGGVSPGASRTFAELAGVREIEPAGRSWTGQMTVGLLGLFRGTSTFSAFYTYTRSRDVASGVPAPGGVGASTAGDPSAREWATADFEQRHTLQGMVDFRVGRWMSVAAIGSLASGLPYTPSVDGDINGDGYSNDRAFAFDPASTRDPALAVGMERLLDEAPAAARGCLREELGRVARRNSCRTPSNPTLDVLAYLRPTGQSRRLRVSVRASNVTAGLDYLLHGANGLRGWGQIPFADATLLHVRGFDAASSTYRYEVNPRFGEVLGARGFLRSPMTVAIQARITLGADPAYQSFARTVAAVGRSSPERVRARLAESIPNVPVQVLAANASRPLGLTPDQADRLSAAGDSLRAPVERLVQDLADLLRSAPPSRRSAAQRSRIEELSRSAAALVAQGQESARAILAPAQWSALPPALTSPPHPVEEGSQNVTIPTG